MHETPYLYPRRGRAISLLLLTIITAVGAASSIAQDVVQAQELDRARVVSDGIGTVYVSPTHVSFWMHKTVTAESLEGALTASFNVGTAVRAEVEDRGLNPSRIEAAVPAVVSLEENAVRASVEMRFSMAVYSGEVGAAKFGELCDNVKRVAEATGCVPTGPIMVTTNEDAVIQAAVGEAAKNAYIGAAGAAAALNVSVRVVDRVEVGEITWNDPPETPVAYPTMEELTCTARVRITYTLE